MTTAEHKNIRIAEGGMTGNARLWHYLRVVGWSLAVLILLLPIVASWFTDEVKWSPGDYLLAAIVLGGIGLLFELTIRRSNNDAYRTGVVLALASIFLMAWSNAAVGFVGSGANAVNVLYFLMLALPLIGGAVSGLKARGLFITMMLTASVQVLITVFTFAAVPVVGDATALILAINAVFILLWIGAAVLFHQAAARSASLMVAFGRGTTALQRSPVRFVLSLLMMAIGAVMLGAMVSIEGEPGMIPLLVFALGTGWFCLTLFRSRKVG